MDQEQRGKKGTIAGILMIIAFILAILAASEVLFLDIGTVNLDEQAGGEIEEDIDQDYIQSILNVCGVLILVFGVFLLIGGIFAIKRIHWGIALLGAILGLFSIGPWFLGTILSLAALVLIFLSRDEFKEEGEDKGDIEPNSLKKQPSERLVEQEE